MEDQTATYINQNVNNDNIYEMPDSEEDKADHLYDRVLEDPASPSSTTTMPEMMDLSQESNEDSRSSSVASQHGPDEESSSSSEHSAADEHLYQDVGHMSPAQEDKPMTFESSEFCPPGFHLRRSQSTSTSPTSLKFPHGSNIGENNNSEEEYEIFMFVKVRAWVLLRTH